MIEKICDMWTVEHAHAICVTTNGTLRKDGSCVMGRGCAREAVVKYGPQIERRLGAQIKEHGNHVFIIGDDQPMVVSFPVKGEWWDRANVELICRSARELVTLVIDMKWQRVVIPRPGCGNGGLQWDDVRPRLETILSDDRFLIVDKKPNASTTRRTTGVTRSMKL